MNEGVLTAIRTLPNNADAILAAVDLIAHELQRKADAARVPLGEVAARFSAALVHEIVVTG